MKFQTAMCAATLLFFAQVNAHAQQSVGASNIQIEVNGSVMTPGTLHVAQGSRLSDALIAAQPTSKAYLPGIMFLSGQAKGNQVRLRAGLEHDLGELQRSTRPPVQEAAAVLAAWLEGAEATGRVLQTVDIRLLQVQPHTNPVLQDGDSVEVPERPTTIRVMGAVKAECRLRHEPLREARDYLRDCETSAAADRNHLYVVQPDGIVQKLGIASWNRADPQSVAPGGTVYVPLSESAASIVDETFNADFAAFLATQPIIF